MRSIRRRRGSFTKGEMCPPMREDLKKKDEEFLMFVERLSSLEGALKRKEEELELSKGVVVQCQDLQSHVD